jgi:hypothetical protein
LPVSRKEAGSRRQEAGTAVFTCLFRREGLKCKERQAILLAGARRGCPMQDYGDVEKFSDCLWANGSWSLPMTVDRLWKAIWVDFPLLGLKLFMPHIFELLDPDTQPIISCGTEIYKGAGIRKPDIYMILKARECPEYKGRFFEFTGLEYGKTTAAPIIKCFIEQQEENDPLMRFRISETYAVIKMSPPLGVTTGFLLATGNAPKVDGYLVRFGGFTELVDFPVFYSRDFGLESIKMSGNNLFAVAMYASHQAAMVGKGKSRKEEIIERVTALKKLILSLGLDAAQKNAAFTFIVASFRLDDKELGLGDDFPRGVQGGWNRLSGQARRYHQEVLRG